ISSMATPGNSADKPLAERSPFTTTSFQKKTRSKLISIPGTRPSVQNGQLLVSTGVTSLDYLLGGGLAVGTVLLIEEDQYDSYSHMIVKYFLAEGVVCQHELFMAAAQDDPDDILQELPHPILDDVVIHNPVEQPTLSCKCQDSLDSMKIAWRYQNLPKSTLASSSRFGHYYDVSKTMEPDIRQAAKCHRFFLPEHLTQSSPYKSSQGTLQKLKLKTQQIPYEQALGDSGEEKLPLTEEKTSSRTGLSLGGHLPRPVGVSG
uniref:Elongator complex protein 4 n=1 Tax=Mastacembelus armatus TaxID=205130 RepID=A0A7N9ARV8_9TELE